MLSPQDSRVILEVEQPQSAEWFRITKYCLVNIGKLLSNGGTQLPVSSYALMYLNQQVVAFFQKSDSGSKCRMGRKRAITS